MKSAAANTLGISLVSAVFAQSGTSWVDSVSGGPYTASPSSFSGGVATFNNTIVDFGNDTRWDINNADKTIIIKLATHDAGADSFFLGTWGRSGGSFPTDYGWRIGVQGGTGCWYFLVNDASGNQDEDDTSISATADTLIELAVVCTNGVGFKWYANGTLMATVAETHTGHALSTTHLLFNEKGDSGTTYNATQFAHMLVWNRALSGTEVAAVFANPMAPL